MSVGVTTSLIHTTDKWGQTTFIVTRFDPQ
jgi:hypothetical protein